MQPIQVLPSAYVRMLWPTIWDWSLFPCNREEWWKRDSRGGHCEQQWSWNFAVGQVTTSLRQQLWVGQTAEIGCVAEWKSELCGADDRKTTGVITAPDLNQQSGKKTWNMREEAWGHVLEESFNEYEWGSMTATDLHSMDSMSKGPYIAAKPKLNIFIFLATTYT